MRMVPSSPLLETDMNTQINMQEREVSLLTDEELDAVTGGFQSAAGNVIKTFGDALSAAARKQ
jgi:hypothetical protein